MITSKTIPLTLFATGKPDRQVRNIMKPSLFPRGIKEQEATMDDKDDKGDNFFRVGILTNLLKPLR